MNEKVKIGRNVNISQGIIIGQLSRGKCMGSQSLVMRFILVQMRKYCGILLFAIGANAVVLDDVPDNACFAGIPAKIVSMNGSDGYVNRKV